MIKEFEQKLATCRRDERYDDAYGILSPMLETVSGQLLGIAKLQYAFTRFSEAADTAHIALRLTDESLILLDGDAEHTAMALTMGMMYAQYASDSPHCKNYANQARALMVTGAPDALPWHGRLLTYIGYYFHGLSKYGQALAHLEEARDFYGHHMGPHSESDCRCQLRLIHAAIAEALLALGRSAQATAALRSALAIASPSALDAMAYLKGRIAASQGRCGEAEAYLRQALDLATSDHRLRLRVVEALGWLYRDSERWEELDALIKTYRKEAMKGRSVQNLLRLQRLAIRNIGGGVASC